MKNNTFSTIVERLEKAEKYTIFVVGDSITEGARATGREKTYTAVFTEGLAKKFPERTVIRYDGKRQPVPDAELLPLECYEGPFAVQNGNEKTITVVRSGIGGNTVKRMLNRQNDFIGKKFDGNRPDLYIIMVGINDALKQDASKYVTHDVFYQHLGSLIDAIENGEPDADVILMTPTYNDRGETNESHLAPYVAEMRRICNERAIPIIDQHRLWMEHMTVGGENYGQGDWLCGVNGDSCHPCDKGHAVIANEMLRAIFEENAE